MSISTTTTSVTYAGNNSDSTPYPIPFKYLTDADVSVYFDGVLQTLGAGQDYTITGSGLDLTGSIVTTVAQADTVVVGVYLDIALDQPVVLQETGSLPAKTIEVEGFDRLNMQVRRVWRKLQDVLTFNTDEANGSTGTADNLLGFDGSGDIAEIPNTTFLQTANDLSDVTAATARTNLNVDVAGTDNSTDVTKAGAGTYVSLDTGTQVLTVDPIDEADLNASINASLDLADTSIQSLASIEGNSLLSTGETSGSKFLRENGDDTCSWIDLSGLGVGDALQSSPLSQFAETTAAQLAGVITAGQTEGTGDLVFATSPTLVTPDLGTPSAVDLTNATNYPETNGTVQGTGANTYNIVAADEGTIASTTVRGENSVDLQMDRDNGDEVASGARSGIFVGRRNKATGAQAVAIGGTSNTSSGNDGVVSGNQNTNVSPRGVCMGGIVNDITGTGSNHVLLGGTNNEISATVSHSGIIAGNNNTVSAGNCAVLAGQRNVLSGTNAVALGATDGVASGADTLIAGGDATASHDGARVFGDTSVDPISSIANNEFAIQGSALRLVDGNQGAGKVLTADANGSGNWAYANGVGDSVTGTATFTNSTNNIALTGVDGLTGLAVGDVIEVTGSTSNNDVFTVEVITTDNIIVNQAHAGGTTSKSLTDETSTASVTVTLVCKANNAPLGYGQGWVGDTRTANTTYTNTTGRTICYSHVAMPNGAGSTASHTFNIDGNTVFYVSTGVNREFFISYNIPNTLSYQFINVNTNVSSIRELR